MKKTYIAPQLEQLHFAPEAHMLLESGNKDSLNMGEASDAGGASESLSAQRIWHNDDAPIWGNE